VEPRHTLFLTPFLTTEVGRNGEEKVSGIRAREFDENCRVINFAHVEDALVGVRDLAGGGRGRDSEANAPSVVSPNIILITLDTTRADRMGFLGSKRGLTPNLDALAHQSTVFTRAYAQAPLTTVSHATILTGTYPQFHQVLDFTYPLAKDLPYAPDILRAHGYRTAAFLGSLCWTRAWGSRF